MLLQALQGDSVETRPVSRMGRLVPLCLACLWVLSTQHSYGSGWVLSTWGRACSCWSLLAAVRHAAAVTVGDHGARAGDAAGRAG
jgi:hypothetical protein